MIALLECEHLSSKELTITMPQLHKMQYQIATVIGRY